MSLSAEAFVREAMLLERQGRLFEAAAAYQRALVLRSDLPDCWYNLARLQRQAGQFAESLASYQRALDGGIAQAEEVHLNRGVIFSDCLHQYAAAERELRKALELNPNYAPALMNYANLHEDLGRREAAAELYERLLAVTPESPQALSRYAGLKHFSDLDDPMIARLRKALNREGIGAAGQASLEFALGRALDAVGDYEAAFATYRNANRHSRESVPRAMANYDRARQEAFTEKLIAAFPARPPISIAAGPSASQPIFICGMFRSGSTLTEQLLAGHPSITPGGELDCLPRAVATELAPYPESVGAASAEKLAIVAAVYRRMINRLFPGAVYVTDKRPDNFMHIGLIKTLFPRAKIVHTMRNPLDTCLSIYFLHLDQGMSYALELMDIGHYYRQYRRLMAHWREHYGEDIIDVHYERLVADHGSEVERLLGFVGLGGDERGTSLPTAAGPVVKTSSVWQVREPLHGRSCGRWRHYEYQLRELGNYLEGLS